MNIREILPLLGILSFSACAPIREVVDSDEGPTIAEALESIQEKSVTVSLRDSSVCEGVVVHSPPDTLVLIPEGEEVGKSIPLKDVAVIRFKSSSGKFILGGAVAGGVIGAGIGFAMSSSKSSGGGGFHFDLGGVAASIGALVGINAGLIVGAIAAAPQSELLFVDSAMQLVTIEVKSYQQVTRGRDVYVNFLWQDRSFYLPARLVQIRRENESVFITAMKADLVKAGIIPG